MNNSFNDDSENDSINLVQYFKYSSFLDKFGEYKENKLKEKKELNDNSIKDISKSFLGNKTKREESKIIKNIEIKVNKNRNRNDIKKRGRKKKFEIKGSHTKNAEDNKMIKIKMFIINNFHNFLNKILRYVEFDAININLNRHFIF